VFRSSAPPCPAGNTDLSASARGGLLRQGYAGREDLPFRLDPGV